MRSNLVAASLLALAGGLMPSGGAEIVPRPAAGFLPAPAANSSKHRSRSGSNGKAGAVGKRRKANKAAHKARMKNRR